MPSARIAKRPPGSTYAESSFRSLTTPTSVRRIARTPPSRISGIVRAWARGAPRLRENHKRAESRAGSMCERVLRDAHRDRERRARRADARVAGSVDARDHDGDAE